MNGLSSLNNHFKLLYWSGCFLILVLMMLYANNQIMTGDQYQMINKGYLGAYQNNWLQYGNAASAVGNVPGPLSAWVVGVPLLVWNSPWAPMLFLLALHLASFFLFDSIIKSVYKNEIRLVFLVLYGLNPWFLFESLLYNPAYLFFFSALHLFSAFHSRKDASFWFTFLHLLSIGLAMQLHYSWVVLAAISGYLLFRGLVKVNVWGAIAALLVIAYSLMPYFQELLVNESLQVNDGNKDGEHYIGWGFVHIYPMIKAVLYWLRYASFFFNSFLLSSISFEWITNNEQIQTILVGGYKTVVYLIGLGTFWVSYKANKFLYLQVKPLLKGRLCNSHVNKQNWLFLFVIGTFISLLVSSALSPIVFNYWHLIIIFPFALIPLVSYINQNKNNRYALKLFYSVIVYFLIVNVVALNDSRKYSYKVSYEDQTRKYVVENKL